MDDLLKLLELLHHHDDLFSQLSAEQGILNEQAVFVTVADDEAFWVPMNSDGGKKFRFAASFDAEVERFSGVDDFLYDFAKLVHFDGEHAAVGGFVTGLVDGVPECSIDLFDAVPQQVLEAEHHWEGEASGLCLLQHLNHVDRRAGVLRWHHVEVASIVDAEVTGAPTVDVVERDGGRDVPRLIHVRKRE
ncbi:MAG: hypothetical protein RIS92_3024 [Verrucomicrobiota bacterium]